MKVICFGDSNTWGYDPRSYFGERYEQGWVELLGKVSGWHTVNRGQNGRTIPEDPVLIPPETRLFLVMLGTNDLLQGFSAEETAERMRDFLLPMDHEHLMLIAPPPLIRGAWVEDDALLQSSLELAAAYRRVAAELNVAFVDAGTWNIPLAFDGVHFREEGHRIFAERLYKYIKEEQIC